MDRVLIQWTDTAKAGLAKLPKKVRRGILDKAAALRDVEDPSAYHKPLKGPLQGYNRLCYSRYRAIYSCEREELANGDAIVHIIVRFVVVGIRKEGDKNDIYNLAKRLIELGLIETQDSLAGDSGGGRLDQL